MEYIEYVDGKKVKRILPYISSGGPKLKQGFRYPSQIDELVAAVLHLDRKLDLILKKLETKS